MPLHYWVHFQREKKKSINDKIKLNDTGKKMNEATSREGAKAVLRGEMRAYASAKKRRREQVKKELEVQIKLPEDTPKRKPDSATTDEVKKKRKRNVQNSVNG